MISDQMKSIMQAISRKCMATEMSRGRGCVNSAFFGGAGENGEKFLTFCEEKFADLLPKNTSTRRITTAIFRISARLNVPLYPEFAEEKTVKDGNLTSIKAGF